MVNLSLLGLLAFAVLFTFWFIKQPKLEITEDGLRVFNRMLYRNTYIYWFKHLFIRWDDIEGAEFIEQKEFGITLLRIAMLYMRGEKTLGESLRLNIKDWQDPDEIVDILKSKIPEVRYDNIRHYEVFRKPFQSTELACGKWKLSEAGISRSGELIDWEDVKSVKTMKGAFDIPSIKVHYLDSGMKEATFVVKASNTRLFRDYTRYLIQHSSQAEISPGLLKFIESSKWDVTEKRLMLFLACGTLVLGAVTSFLIFYIPPGKIAMLCFPSIVVACIAALLIGLWQIEKNYERVSRETNKTLFQVLLLFCPIVMLILPLLVIPHIVPYISGNIYKKTGQLDKADYYYHKALDMCPENHRLIHDMGLLYLEKGNIEVACEYIKRSYVQRGLGLKRSANIPEVLASAGKYQEALEWCDKILKDHGGNHRNPYIKAIRKKKEEILQKMKDSS